MKVLKKIVIFLLALVIGFDIFVIATSLLTKTKILNAKYYEQKFKQNGLYAHLSKLINTNLEGIALENNINKSIFKGLVDEKFVEDNINRITIQTIDFFLKTEKNLPKVNLSLDREIIKISEDYLNKNKIPMTREIKEEMDSMATHVNQVVENYILPVNLEGIQNKDYVQQTRNVLNNLYNNIKKYIIIFLVATGLLLVINKFTAIKTLATILEIVGITLATPFYTIYFMKILNGIAIGDEVLKSTLVSVVNGYMLYLANFGLLAMVIGFVLYVLYSKLNKVSPR